MKTITIIFVGIIAHVNQPGMSLDDTAVLPYVVQHLAQMVVDRNAIVNDDNDPWIREYCKGRMCRFPLTGFAVTLEGTTGWFCNKDAVARAVPKLTKVAVKCSGLKEVIRDRDVTSEFVSYIDYGAGRLTVDTYFHKKLGFKDEQENDPPAELHTCVACRTRYDGVLSGNEAVFVFRKDTDPEVDDDKDDAVTHRIRIKADHHVTVENNPVENHDAGGTPSHFLAYYKLFRRCPAEPAPSIVYRCTQPNICDVGYARKGALREERVPLADCTNSQYP